MGNNELDKDYYEAAIKRLKEHNVLMEEEIYKFYMIALLDIAEGVSLEELEIHLKLYEDEGNYEACAGILKAINKTKDDRQFFHEWYNCKHRDTYEFDKI